MTEIVETMRGIPYWFKASVLELDEAFAAIPDALLVEAYEREWTSRGLRPPRLSVRRLRSTILAIHKRKAERLPRERLLTVAEAAPHLGLTERQLRHSVDQGDYEEDLVTLKDGRRGLRFQPTAVNWSLCPMRPDPRIVMLMSQEGVESGQRHRLGYTRRDGAEWKSTW